MTDSDKKLFEIVQFFHSLNSLTKNDIRQIIKNDLSTRDFFKYKNNIFSISFSIGSRYSYMDYLEGFSLHIKNKKDVIHDIYFDFEQDKLCVENLLIFLSYFKNAINLKFPELNFDTDRIIDELYLIVIILRVDWSV